jgi:hypothetical protein
MTPAEIAAGGRQARRSLQWCLTFRPDAVETPHRRAMPSLLIRLH